MTEPTDDELDAVLCNQWPAFSMQATLVRAWVRAAMRDALAKWGTPPAVAGEPVAYRHMHDDGWEYYDAPTGSDCPGCEPLYTTTQPTQPQAGAVQLTVEKINAMAREYPAEDLCGWSYRMGIADTERHHGIKGGQHGTE